MLINDKALKHWVDNFYGYGSWQSGIWFVALEDAGGDLPEEVAEKFNYFLKAHPISRQEAVLCDIREMYKEMRFYSDSPRADLFTNMYDYRFGSNAIQNGFWRNLIAFSDGYRGQEMTDPLQYQKTSFTINAETLIKLYPLPSHTHAWYYSWLDMPQFPFLRTRALYKEYVYEARMKIILGKLSEHKPQLVVMYGMENINMLKDTFSQFFDGLKFKMVKATKGIIPQHHRSQIGATTVLITTQIPGLRHGRIETGFDWYEFGKTAKLPLAT